MIRRDVKFMEDRAFQKSRDMPTKDQTAEVPLVQEQQGHQEEQTERQTLVPSTSTNVFLEEDQEDTQFEEQPDQEEELREQPSTSGRISREAQQILRDAKKFIGTPRDGKTP